MHSQIMLLKSDKAISTKYTKNHFGSVATPVNCKILIYPQLLHFKHDYYSAQLQQK